MLQFPMIACNAAILQGLSNYLIFNILFALQNSISTKIVAGYSMCSTQLKSDRFDRFKTECFIFCTFRSRKGSKAKQAF